MSNKITQLCRPLRMSPARKAVLMCLADFSRDDGKDWHSVAAIMEWTCLGRRTIFDALEWLEGEGLIAVQRRQGAKNTTFLQLDRIAALTNQCASRTGDCGEPVRQLHPSGDHATVAGAQPVRQPHGFPDETSAGAAPVRGLHPCGSRTDPCGSRTPTSAAAALTRAAAAPEALEASVKHEEASRDAARATSGASTNDAASAPSDADRACKLVRMAGVADAVAAHPGLLGLLSAGVTPNQLAETARAMVEKGKTSFAYLLATVEGRLRDAAAKGAVPVAPAPAAVQPAESLSDYHARQQREREAATAGITQAGATAGIAKLKALRGAAA